jgi:hypothetical protein
MLASGHGREDIGRRAFLRRAGGGFAVLTLTVLGCGGGDDPPDFQCTAGLASTSSNVAEHVHRLCVPYADLESPPQAGQTYMTSTDGNHIHLVTLTFQQLTQIGQGMEVTVTSSINSGHSHDHTLRR